jgi:hypothetical protein
MQNGRRKDAMRNYDVSLQKIKVYLSTKTKEFCIVEDMHSSSSEQLFLHVEGR